MTGDDDRREAARDSLLSGGERVSKGRQRDTPSLWTVLSDWWETVGDGS